MEEAEDGTSIEKPAMTKQNKLIKYALASLTVLIGIGFVVAIVVVVVLHFSSPIPDERGTSTTEEMTTTSPVGSDEPTAKDIFSYYPEANRDGLKIKFYHGANSQEDLAIALAGNYSQALEGDVNLRYYGSPSQKDEAVMNNPPEQIADVTLEQWLYAVIPSLRVIKLDLTIDEVVPIVLESLRSKSNVICQPVWINVEILEGPGSSRRNPLNKDEFFTQLNAIFPHVTLSLGWTNAIDYTDKPEYSWKMIDEMVEVAQGVSQRVTILARVALVRNSWDRFLWLLEEHERFSLTVYDQSTDIIQAEDVAYVRDNLDYSRVFYDITESTMEDLQNELASSKRVKNFYSGGNVLDYFRIPNREAIQVTWAHRVVGKEDLSRTLYDDNILMIETDVQLFRNIPVMDHDPPVLDYELTLEEWMNEVIASNQTKGIKLDFKSIEALEASLPILNEMKPSLRMPVWINSDVMQGPNSLTEPRNATLFFSMIQEQFPDVTISPGWTTTYRPTGNNEAYTQEMVEEMYAACSSLRQAITFPVRASLSQRSITQFQWLLAKSNRYTLTIWHSTNEVVLTSDLLEVYQSFPKNKVYFDIPDEMMKELLEAIANSS